MNISIDYSQYLLSKSKVKDMHYFLREHKALLDTWNSKYDFYAKNQHSSMIRIRLKKTKDEMWAIALECIPKIEDLEYEIADAEHKLHMNRLAIAELKDSNMPFKGIKLSEHELIQQSLF